MEKQVRYNDSSDVNINNQYVEGYALVFDKKSCDLGGYREIISPSAISQEILDASDIFCYLNHNESYGVLERRRFGVGGLELTIDETGLLYRFKLGDSSLCNDLRYYLERKIITKSSFSFTVSDYQWKDTASGDPWYDKDGLQQMTITKFDKLFDCSPVFEPAYQSTSVSLHNGEFRNKEFVEECSKRKLNRSVGKPDDQYYKNIRKKYNLFK
jgi:HK97 family phage prohead protease